MRMQTWRLASAVQAQSPPGQIAALVGEFDQTLALLGKGDPARPLFVPWDAESRQAFEQVQTLWLTTRAHWVQRGATDVLETQHLAGELVAPPIGLCWVSSGSSLATPPSSTCFSS
ncbi:MAG: type IV pili methyl-accepting chemotaxis transducer N-terminal domain-containing protein [Burkholderiaceae bacterium]